MLEPEARSELWRGSRLPSQNLGWGVRDEARCRRSEAVAGAMGRDQKVVGQIGGVARAIAGEPGRGQCNDARRGGFHLLLREQGAGPED